MEGVSNKVSYSCEHKDIMPFVSSTRIATGAIVVFLLN